MTKIRRATKLTAVGAGDDTVDVTVYVAAPHAGTRRFYARVLSRALMGELGDGAVTETDVRIVERLPPEAAGSS